MKPSDIDSWMVKAFHEMAEDSDANAESAREAIWRKTDDSRKYSAKGLMLRMSLAVAATLVIAFFVFYNPSPKASWLLAERINKNTSISGIEPVNYADSLIRDTLMFFRETFSTMTPVHDTIVVPVFQTTYLTIHDTIMIKELEEDAYPTLAIQDANSDFLFEEMPKEQKVRGILWWRSKTAFPANKASAEVSRSDRKFPIRFPVISAQ